MTGIASDDARLLADVAESERLLYRCDAEQNGGLVIAPVADADDYYDNAADWHKILFPVVIRIKRSGCYHKYHPAAW